jgi:RNA polymerase sigma-70 factor (ECF subfamily)
MIDRAQLDAWMAAAADGERAAIEPLFRALWPLAVGYARRLVGDAAEDCAQDALIALFGQLARYDRERDALTWALTLTTWQCRTVRRRADRRGAIELPAPAPIDGVSVVERRDLVRAALAALEALAPHDVEAIARAITEAPGELPAATLRKRLERALARLRLSWRSRHGTL